MSRCARCDFRTISDQEQRPREQLLEHADQAGHPLCVVCQRSITHSEIQTCEPCLTQARTLLSGIVMMWAELPRHIGNLCGTSYDSDRPGGVDGEPLPGGDALVLAGPGGSGQTGRRLTAMELLDGKIQHLDGREHAVDNKPTDPSSVAQVLISWEDDWRHIHGEPAALLPGASLSKVTRAASRYLDTHCRWAANNHDAFDEFASDLRHLHTRLERVTGRESRQPRAEAECFDCGADALVRQSRPAKVCKHQRPTQQRGFYETARQREDRLLAWDTKHARCEQGGFENHWTCQRCNASYSWERYLLAISARLQTSDVPGWGLPEQVGFVLGVNPRTVRSWADREKVATACAVRDRPKDEQIRAGRRAPLRVWWDDARQLSEALRERTEKLRERTKVAS